MFANVPLFFCTFTCQCGAIDKVYVGLTKLWELVVCAKSEIEKWHVKKCLFGECNECGVKNVVVCLVESSGASPRIVEW